MVVAAAMVFIRCHRCARGGCMLQRPWRVAAHSGSTTFFGAHAIHLSVHGIIAYVRHTCEHIGPQQFVPLSVALQSIPEVAVTCLLATCVCSSSVHHMRSCAVSAGHDGCVQSIGVDALPGLTREAFPDRRREARACPCARNLESSTAPVDPPSRSTASVDPPSLRRTRHFQPWRGRSSRC